MAEAKRRGKGDVLILCYHAVSEDWSSPLSVTPQALEGQMQFLASKGYTGVTFTEAALEDHPGKVVAVTFDDAYDSVRQLARPILDRVESLRSAAEAGWEVGSHTVSHPMLTTLRDAELHEELVRSREECGRMIGTTCQSIAFPYGDCDERVIEASREAGYSAVATIPWRLERSGRFVWPRTGIFHNDSKRVFRLKVSPAVRRLRASRISSRFAPLVYFIRQGRDRDGSTP